MCVWVCACVCACVSVYIPFVCGFECVRVCVCPSCVCQLVHANALYDRVPQTANCHSKTRTASALSTLRPATAVGMIADWSS